MAIKKKKAPKKAGKPIKKAAAKKPAAKKSVKKSAPKAASRTSELAIAGGIELAKSKIIKVTETKGLTMGRLK